ncbi:MAG: hypothetical protein P1U32_04890 [Legionellaceae bacterium]|nr:hypothetical protein [Legionellaceae bacterium]
MVKSSPSEALKTMLYRARKITEKELNEWTDELLRLDTHDLSDEEIALRNDIYNCLWDLASKNGLSWVLTVEDWEQLNEMGVHRSWLRVLEEMRQTAEAGVREVVDLYTGDLYDMQDEPEEASSLNTEETPSKAEAIPIEQLPTEAFKVYKRAVSDISVAKKTIKGYLKYPAAWSALDTLALHLKNMFDDTGKRVMDVHQVHRVVDEYLKKEANLEFRDDVKSVEYYQAREGLNAMIRAVLNYVTVFFTFGKKSHENMFYKDKQKRSFFFQSSEEQQLQRQVAERRENLKAILYELEGAVTCFEERMDKINEGKENVSLNRGYH